MMHYLKVVMVCFLASLLQPVLAEVSTNNWYVGNTKPGAWIQYNKVWLSAGTYRFTVRAVAKDQAKTVKLQLNGTDLKTGVVIPANAGNEFQLVHLGSKQLTEGYYDVRLVFETGDVNCDMVFIRKGTSTSTEVSTDDLHFVTDFTGKPLMAPIGGVSYGTAFLGKGGDAGDEAMWTDNNGALFSRRQMLSWYKQQMYTYCWPISDEAQDIYVQELVESKVDFLYMHGRGELDTNYALEDRGYTTGIGGMGCYQNRKLIDAIKRNEFAKDNIKVAYFCDNAVFPLACQEYLKKEMNWGDVACQEFLWNYTYRKWYESVPRDMLYQITPGVVPIQMWSANANYNYNTSDSKIYEFLKYIEGKMKSEFNLQVAWVLDGTFMSRDARTIALAYGKQGWFIWGQNITQMVSHNDKKFAFALNGGRYPLRTVWFNDWDPVANTGTHSDSEKDYHVSSITSNGTPMIRSVYQNALNQKAEWLVMESWWDWYEGSIYCRSENPEHKYPNQFLSLIREFSDRNSESIILEAEGCDEFSSKSIGNKGGTYRLHWYQDLDKDMIDADLSVDLDIFRPLHKVGTLTNQGMPTSKLKDFSAGFYDVWGFTETGKVYCHEVDGIPANSWVAQKATNGTLKSISLGAYYAWGISTTGRTVSCILSSGQPTQNSGLWQTKTDAITIVGVATTLKEVFGIDRDGSVYYKDLSAKKAWKLIPGGKMKTITADEASVWGFAPTGELVRFSSQSKSDWSSVANPFQLTKIDAGTDEVWGVNALNEVYRISSSGFGEWEKVFTGYVNVSVGYEYVWLQDAAGTMYNCKLEGFEPRTSFGLIPAPITGLNSTSADALSLKVLNNPFTDYLQISISSVMSSTVKLTLLDSSGRTVLTEMKELNPGRNAITLEGLSNLASGVYVLFAEENGNKTVRKVVKI